MSDEPASGWREVAAELADHGVPERRAEVVALIDEGCTHAEVKERLGLSSRGEVSRHVGLYREQRSNAEWLHRHGPDI